jgi:DNA-binding NarL/FixJ family response regulator
MEEPKKILIVDDHILFREGLASLIDNQPDFTVVGEAGSVAKTVELVRAIDPDIVLMDFSLPDGTGADATRIILAERPETEIVFITVHESNEFLMEAVTSGAKGYLLKNLPVEKLLDSLRGLAREEAAISRKMTSQLLYAISNRNEKKQSDSPGIEQLTPREIEVLQEVAMGATNQEVAERLCISVNTVRNHVHNMLRKLSLKNRRELTHFAAEKGFVGRRK